MGYQDNIQKKIAEQKNRLDNKRDENKKERVEEKSRKAITNPNHSMHKLQRLVIGADMDIFTRPMHEYKLASEILIHTSRKNEKNEDKYCHNFCIDVLVMGTNLENEYSCPSCGLEGYKFEGKPIMAKVDYVYSTIGTKRTFIGKEGETVTYYVNPSQVVEIQSDGNGGKVVLPLFDTYDQDGLYAKKNWSINRAAGTKGADGKTRGGGWVNTPKTISDTDLVAKLNLEGVTADLPLYAQAWTDGIKKIQEEKGDQAAKDEVFRYILTSFDNAAQVVEITNKLRQMEGRKDLLVLPVKPVRDNDKKTSNLVLN